MLRADDGPLQRTSRTPLQVLRLTGLHVTDTDALPELAAALSARSSAVRTLDLSFSFLGDAAAEVLARAAVGGDGSGNGSGGGGCKLQSLELRATSVRAAGRAALEAAVADPRCPLRSLLCTSNEVSPRGQHYFVTEPRER